MMSSDSRVVVLILAVGLAGCSGTWLSSRPIYPDSWPALAALPAGRTYPDLSGTYRAVSDEAAPLVYPPGGHPRDMVMFLTYGPPKPVPPLGRRILTWHLAGASKPTHWYLAGAFIDRDRVRDVWSNLTSYAGALKADAAHSDLKDDAGWVRVQELPDGLIEIHAGLHGQTLVNLVLRRESRGLFNNKSHIYECNGGGLLVVGCFPPPAVENPYGFASDVGAKCTFFRAADGSLVMLEEQYSGPTGGTLVFRKWWRWRRIE